MDWPGPGPALHRDRCRPVGTYWIYDYSIGYLAAGAPTRWTSRSGERRRPGRAIHRRGTGVIPTTGLYDTVYDWDMKIELADGVKMTFSRRRLDQVHWHRRLGADLRAGSTPSPSRS